MKAKKRKKKMPAKKKALIAVVVILAVILAALIAVLIGVDSVLSRITKYDDISASISQEELDSIVNEKDEIEADYTGDILEHDDVELSDGPGDISVEESENIINVLLVGQDTYSMQNRSRSDVMILCTINKEEKTLTMTSFMRDLYVKIPDYYNQRLNVAYAVGGFDVLYDTLEYNFGVSVDKGVAVNFESFPEVIEAVGGVDVELTSSEASHLNGKYGFSLSSGMNHLNGEEALQYSRIRKLDSDFNRTSRQRTVMTAVLEKAKTMSLGELYSLVNTLIPIVVTDMSNDEILNLAIDLAPMLSDLTIVSQRIPTDDGYRSAMVSGMAVLIPDLETNRQFLIDTIGQGAE